MAPSLGLQSSTAGKAWHREREAAAQTALAVRKQRDARCGSTHFFPFNAVQDPTTHIQGGSSLLTPVDTPGGLFLLR